MKKRYWIFIALFLFMLFLIVANVSKKEDSNTKGIQPKEPIDLTFAEERVAPGIVLKGPLEGKKAYLLDKQMNIPGCWKDSAHWTGSELLYAVTSVDFSKLIAGDAYEYKRECQPPKGQRSGEFDIYAAKPVNGQWNINNQNMNTDAADAGMSLSDETMAYIIYYGEPKSWDIYLVERKSGNEWNKPKSFEHNSKCREDNPEIYANASRMIFESNRKDALGNECDEEDAMKLWYAEKTEGAWSVPVLLAGKPNEGKKNTQPWVDEEKGYLYWTDDKGCGCIRRIPFDGKLVYGEAEDVVYPNTKALLEGNAEGQVVFVGEYSQSGEYAFITCALAKEGGKFLDKWGIEINICVIPLS